MKREVVQDFLNLPGITGVALMDGRSRPYFFGVDQTLNFQQKEALAQGIQQVVETIPPDFEFFEFQFTSHQVYIYKLDHGIILLVLTSDNLSYPAYVRLVEQLKLELENDLANAIATFRLLAGNLTLTSQSVRPPTVAAPNPPLTPDVSVPNNGTPMPMETPVVAKVSTQATQDEQPSRTSTSTHSPLKPPTKVPDAPQARHPANGATAPPQPPKAPTGGTSDAPKPASPPAQKATTPLPSSEPVAPKSDVQPPPVAKPICLQDVVNTLNQVSQFTKQYLGATVVYNYWKTSTPKVDWLQIFEFDRTGHFSLVSDGTVAPNQPLNDEQKEWIRQWIKAFVKRCSIVIRDFPNLIKQLDVKEHCKELL